MIFSIGCLKLKEIKISSVGEKVEQQEHLNTAVWDTNYYNYLGRVWQFIKKLNILQPCDPDITVLGIYLKKQKHTKI